MCDNTKVSKITTVTEMYIKIINGLLSKWQAFIKNVCCMCVDVNTFKF